MDQPQPRPRPRTRPLVAVLALAVLLFGYGLGRGLPDTFDQDEITPGDVLAALTRGPEHWPVRYPLLQLDLLAPLYRLETRLLGDPGQPFEADNWHRLFAVNRLLSLLMALGTVGCAWLAARRLWRGDARSATLAALAATVVYPGIYYAKTGNLDGPYTFWFAAALWLLFRALAERRATDHVLCALAAAAAVATKDQAYGLFLPFPLLVLANLAGERRRRGRNPAGALLDRRALLAGLAGLALFLLVSRVPADGGYWLREHVAVITGGDTAAARHYPPTLAGQWAMAGEALRQLDWSLGSPLLLAAAAGTAAALRGRRAVRSQAAAALACAASYYLAFIAPIGYHWDRYFLPVCLVLALFAGGALAAVVRHSPRLGGTLVTLVFGLALLRGACLDWLLVHDSRLVLAEAVAADRVPLHAVGHSINRQLPVLPAIEWRYAIPEHALADAGVRRFVINVTDTLHAGQRPAAQEFLRALVRGDRGYRLVALHRSRPPLLFLEDRHRPWADVHTNLGLQNPLLAEFALPAQSSLGRAIDRSAGDPDQLLVRAAVARGRFRFRLAVTLDDEARCVAPDRADAAFFAAVDRAAFGDDAGALAAFAVAIDLAPEWPDPRLERARLWLRLGHVDQARADLDRATATAGPSAAAWQALADLLPWVGQPAAAARAGEQAVGLAGGARPPALRWVDFPPLPDRVPARKTRAVRE